jgi:hypothetical protein
VKSFLPATGTTALLEALAPFVPDQFINESFWPKSHPGRRNYFSDAQLWRVHLLALLTSAHSFNAVVRLLPEQRSWRRFARLNHRERTPDVRMLNEFRARVGVAGLRLINEQLLLRTLAFLPNGGKTVAIIDATDLPASTADKKKNEVLGRRRGRHWEHVHSRLGTPGFSLAIKSILCVYGCAIMRQRCC